MCILNRTSQYELATLLPRPNSLNGALLAAILRLAYDAADSGLLGSNLAAGIRRVKGVKKLDVRVGCQLSEVIVLKRKTATCDLYEK